MVPATARYVLVGLILVLDCFVIGAVAGVPNAADECISPAQLCTALREASGSVATLCITEDYRREPGAEASVLDGRQSSGGSCATLASGSEITVECGNANGHCSLPIGSSPRSLSSVIEVSAGASLTISRMNVTDFSVETMFSVSGGGSTGGGTGSSAMGRLSLSAVTVGSGKVGRAVIVVDDSVTGRAEGSGAGSGSPVSVLRKTKQPQDKGQRSAAVELFDVVFRDIEVGRSTPAAGAPFASMARTTTTTAAAAVIVAPCLATNVGGGFAGSRPVAAHSVVYDLSAGTRSFACSRSHSDREDAVAVHKEVAAGEQQQPGRHEGRGHGLPLDARVGGRALLQNDTDSTTPPPPPSGGGGLDSLAGAIGAGVFSFLILVGFCFLLYKGYQANKEDDEVGTDGFTDTETGEKTGGGWKTTPVRAEPKTATITEAPPANLTSMQAAQVPIDFEKPQRASITDVEAVGPQDVVVVNSPAFDNSNSVAHVTSSTPPGGHGRTNGNGNGHQPNNTAYLESVQVEIPDLTPSPGPVLVRTEVVNVNDGGSSSGGGAGGGGGDASVMPGGIKPGGIQPGGVKPGGVKPGGVPGGHIEATDSFEMPSMVASMQGNIMTMDPAAADYPEFLRTEDIGNDLESVQFMNPDIESVNFSVIGGHQSMIASQRFTNFAAGGAGTASAASSVTSQGAPPLPARRGTADSKGIKAEL